MAIFSSGNIEQRVDNWTLTSDFICVGKWRESRFSENRGGHRAILSRRQRLGIPGLWWAMLQNESKSVNILSELKCEEKKNESIIKESNCIFYTHYFAIMAGGFRPCSSDFSVRDHDFNKCIFWC